MGYTEDRKWSDIYINQAKAILGWNSWRISSFEQDTKRAFDLVLDTSKTRAAIRLRRHGVYDRYPHEFTIRSKRDTKATTEYEKIMKGFGDIMLYGHLSKDGKIEHYFLIDLDVFRDSICSKNIEFQGKSNGDGTHFHAYDVRNFPKNLIMDRR